MVAGRFVALSKGTVGSAVPWKSIKGGECGDALRLYSWFHTCAPGGGKHVELGFSCGVHTDVESLNRAPEIEMAALMRGGSGTVGSWCM